MISYPMGKETNSQLAKFHTTGCSTEASVLLWSIKFELESAEPKEEGIGIGL